MHTSRQLFGIHYFLFVLAAGIENKRFCFHDVNELFLYTLYSCVIHRTSTPPLTMAEMNRDCACSCVKAMPQYLHQIEGIDKFPSVLHKVGNEIYNSASVPLSCVLGFRVK